MSFFSNVNKIFKNQTKEKDFCIDYNHYIDKTFYFNFNYMDIYNNCLLSSDAYLNFGLFKNLKICDWISNWKSNNYEFYIDYTYFRVEDIDLENSFNELNKYSKFSSMNLSKVYWKYNWKNILNYSDYNIQTKFFETVYIGKIRQKFINDPNANKIYLNEINQKFEYRRISLNNNYKIFEDKIDCTNVMQGYLGTCYFLEAISTLSNYGQLLYQLFPNENLNNEGIYEICLFYKGEWQKVLVDDYFFFLKNNNYNSNEIDNFVFTKPVRNCLYSCLLEKAYAKLKGSYADINGGWSKDAFEALTGFESIEIPIQNLNDKTFNYLYNKLREGYLLECATIGHSYSVLDISKKYDIKVRNPWSSLCDEEKIFSYNNNKNDGIFSLSKDKYIEYFKGGTTVCQILFGSTIYSYKLNNIQNYDGYFFYLYFEIFTKSKISLGIYDNDNKPCSSLFFNPKLKNILNNNEYSLKAIRSFKNEINQIINNYENFNYDVYEELEPSKYILKVDFSKINTFALFNKILKVIIKGNINIKYLGCHNIEPNINYIQEYPIDFQRYNYGLRTAELFEKYNNIIKILEKELGVEMHPDSKGFYLETIITNEVEAVIRINKNELKKKICSHDINKDIYFVGDEHIGGKIKGMGKVIKIENDKNDIHELYIGQIDENKIDCYQLDLDKNSDSVILKIPNSVENIKSYLHEHNLKYMSSKVKWICDFCGTYFNENDESFGCRLCDFDLCLQCISSQFKKSPWHCHLVEYKEIVYASNSFICDIKTFKAYVFPEEISLIL